MFLRISSDFRLVQSSIIYHLACAVTALLVSVFTLSNPFCTEPPMLTFCKHQYEHAIPLHKTLQWLPITILRKSKFLSWPTNSWTISGSCLLLKVHLFLLPTCILHSSHTGFFSFLELVKFWQDFEHSFQSNWNVFFPYSVWLAFKKIIYILP